MTKSPSPQGAGTTLRGLRVSSAAWWKRNGAGDSEIAALIGDKSTRMGTHYTRHVEGEVIRAFISSNHTEAGVDFVSPMIGT